MRQHIRNLILGLGLLSTLHLPLPTGFAQGTAFTFQGRLNSGGSLANGSYDMRFAIYDSADGLSTVGAPLTNAAIAVNGGLFTVTLDFGPGIFTGPPRWLEIGVRTNGAISFDTLSPRQQISPTPYAITAGQVISGGLAGGTYPNAVDFNNSANQFSGSFSGNGGALSNLNATTLGGWEVGQFWRVNGNSGIASSWYLGTADNQPLEMRVHGYRGLRLEPAPNSWPNLLVGSTNNLLDADVSAATISGGVGNRIGQTSGSSTVAGGRGNVIGISSAGSYIGGGTGNRMEDGSVRSVISGGWSNWIGGATGSVARGIARDITDGTSNTLLVGETPPGNAFIGGGWANRIGTNCPQGVIVGGRQNAIADGTSILLPFMELQPGDSFIGGGRGNCIDMNTPGNTIVGGGANFLLGDGSVRFIGGGVSNQIAGQGTGDVIVGGGGNSVAGDGSVRFIGGGRNNQILDGTSNTILAGEGNSLEAGSDYAVIGGGWHNANSGLAAVVPGGSRNYAAGAYSYASGRRARALHPGAFVWADSQDADFESTASNQFSIRANGSVRFITSGAGMTLDGRPVLTGNNGAGLIDLNASALATGTVPEARLSGNVALRAGGNKFAGNQTISSGSLGVGTTSPLALLHVHAAITETPSVLLTSGGSWPLSLSQTPSSVMVISNGGAGRIFMPSSGNVGLGGANPLHKLHVGNYGTVATIDNSPVKAVVENINEKGRATLVAVAGPGAASDTTNRVEVVLEADEGQRIGLLGTLSAHPLQIRVDNSTRLVVGTNGNVGIGVTSPANKLHVAGGVSATVFVTTSDRRAKQGFADVSPHEMLQKVAALPIQRWEFKENPGVAHLGATAQDFQATFGLGDTDGGIATVDADGVALAAIQGLNQKVESRARKAEARMEVLEAENAALKARLEKLEQLLSMKNGGVQ